MTNVERLRRARELFNLALEQPPEGRLKFVQEATESDSDLQVQVISLLEAHAAADTFLEEPIGQIQPERQELIGLEVGSYKLKEKLGQGGMGEVFLAERSDGEYRQQVAIKVLLPGLTSHELLSRFRSERQILAGLDHPSIARLLDGGTSLDGRPYFVMEYISGQAIDTYCDQLCLPIDQRLELFRKVCAAVHYAHQNLIVHRDLKPSNILVTADGEVKLLDFGIAKIMQGALSAPSPLQTLSGQQPMTPRYASPEQVDGRPISTASDTYSLGVLLYELLTGRPPYEPAISSIDELAGAIRQANPIRPSVAIFRSSRDNKESTNWELHCRQRSTTPSRLQRRLRGDLDNIALMALRKDPLARYASVEQLSEDVNRHLSGLPVRSRAATARYRAGKFVRRHKVGVTTAAAVFLVLTTLVVLLARQNQLAVSERDRANQESELSRHVSQFLVDLFESPDPTRSQGQEISALELLDRGSSLIQADSELEPQLQARLVTTMGEVYQNLGLYGEAKQLFKVGLDVRRRNLITDHPEILDSYSRLGNVSWYLDEETDAENFLRQALEKREKSLGRKHVQTLQSMADFGAFLSYYEGRQSPRPYLETALRLRRELLGVDHPDTLVSIFDMGNLHYYRGEWQQAVPYFADSLKRRRRVLGNKHPATLESINSLGLTYQSLGAWEQAEGLLRELLELRREVLGEEHSDTCSAKNNLGRMLLHRGQLEAAGPLLESALTVRRRTLGDQHSQTLVSFANYGAWLDASGRPSEAEDYLLKAYESRKRLKGDQALLTLRSKARLGELYSRLGRYEEAEQLLSSALDQLTSTLGSSHRNVGIAARQYGDFLTVVGRYKEAEAHLTQAVEILTTADAEEAAETQRAIRSLAALYQQANAPSRPL